jgi:hypothetical protein
MLIISVFVSFGMSIALVEKSKTWPLKSVRVKLQSLLRKIHWKLPRMLFCTVCTSFWCSLISDIILFFFCHFMGFFYFFFPLSGFITIMFSWIIIEFLNALDKKQEININNYIELPKEVDKKE